MQQHHYHLPDQKGRSYNEQLKRTLSLYISKEISLYVSFFIRSSIQRNRPPWWTTNDTTSTTRARHQGAAPKAAGHGIAPWSGLAKSRRSSRPRGLASGWDGPVIIGNLWKIGTSLRAEVRGKFCEVWGFNAKHWLRAQIRRAFLLNLKDTCMRMHVSMLIKIDFHSFVPSPLAWNLWPVCEPLWRIRKQLGRERTFSSSGSPVGKVLLKVWCGQ